MKKLFRITHAHRAPLTLTFTLTLNAILYCFFGASRRPVPYHGKRFSAVNPIIYIYVYIYIYIYIYVCVCVYTHIHIEREREIYV